MKVVLEEIEGTIARLIPDNGEPPIHVNVDQLPKNYKVGAVYNSETKDEILHFTLLEDETKSRLDRIRSKREALLNRSRKKR